MKYSKILLEKIYGKTLPSNEQLDELITEHLCEVESIEAVGNDSVIDLEITPNRYGDLLSHEGLLKELCAFQKQSYDSVYNKELNLPEVKREKGNAIIEGSSRIIFVHVSGLKQIKTPEWMKNILSACGIQSKSIFVDITNMVMLITGQPVHVYDGSKCTGSFIVTPAHDGEIFTMMGGKNYNLTVNDLVIRDGTKENPNIILGDKSGVLSLAGIKGGENAIVDENTTSAFFELGVFDEKYIRKTSRRLNLATDASKRFSVHRKSSLLDHALKVLLILLKEEADVAVITIEDTKKGEVETSAQVVVSQQEIQRLLGANIDSAEIESILKSLGFQVVVEGELYKVVPPLDRVDIVYPVDVIEEVGRMYGYNNIQEELPRLNFTPHIDQRTLVVTQLRQILSEVGFNEIRNHSLVAQGSLEVASPVSKEKSFLRDTLVTSFKNSVEQSRLNKDFLEASNICLYEIGTIFTKEATEELHVVLFDGTKKKPLIEAFNEQIKDHHLKKVLELISDEDGYTVYKVNYTKADPEGDYAFIGDSTGDTKFTQWGTTPYVSRDVSCFIPSDNTPQEVLGWCMNEQLNYLIKKPYLADTFTKDDKTSVLIRFVFQDASTTLTDAVVNEEIEKIYTMLRSKGCEMR
ncbi:MAG TPA: phenylalanine--tRNA ligase beta subunit-related protein [Candidatus Paceibacterota bacterium]